MNSRRTANQERPWHVACRPILTGIGVALGLGLVSASEAGASTYHVYTSSAASSMTLNASDGFCSLAEAVEHAKGNTIYNCTDFNPGSPEQRIELRESAGRPFSTNHFKITSLTLNRQGVRIRIHGGTGAFIDSTATYSAFVIPFKSIGYFERVTLTNTAGSAGGRLIENSGELALSNVTIKNGNVTGSQHTTGHGGGIFNRNTQGMFWGVISALQNTVITNNKARNGGGIYNDSGIIKNVAAVTISNNTATFAGGGIYNTSTSPGPSVPTNGTVNGFAVAITNNSARTGGGVFNRGLVELLDGSSITGNSATTSGGGGNSAETCTFADPTGNTKPPVSGLCDGSGGGVLSVHLNLGAVTRFQLSNSKLSNNTATSRGGAVFSVGVLELSSNSMNNNRAQDGAAIYAVGPTDGSQQYCNFFGYSGAPAKLHCNATTTAGTGHSIVAGGSQGMSKCTFPGTYLTSGGNSSPRCQAGSYDNTNYTCPVQTNVSCPQQP